MFKSIAINLPVKEPYTSAEFFSKLGFKKLPEFCNESDTMAFKISDQIYFMLLSYEKFKTFTDNEVSNLSNATSSILAVEFESIEEVDKIFNLAITQGAYEYKPLLEYKSEDGELYMYTKSFKDIDNHAWEVYWMKENYIE